jgi:uncharacterized protein (TIGR00255 family)
MRSMTGYGRSSFVYEEIDVSVEASSVNKRNLETIASLPRDWQALERDLLGLAREMVDRGRVNVTIKARQAQSIGKDSSWDENCLSAELERLREFAEKEKIPFHPDASLITRLAANQTNERSLPDHGEVSDSLQAATREALEAMNATRLEEGARLAHDFSARTKTLGDLVDEVEKASVGIAKTWREKLMDRLRQAELEIDLDDERVLREVALFAERCDVSEEITRLRSHGQLLSQIFAEDGCVGRKLEFALQEVSRELNTVASKSPSVEVKRLIIDARSEVEKMREQALNVE